MLDLFDTRHESGLSSQLPPLYTFEVPKDGPVGFVLDPLFAYELKQCYTVAGNAEKAAEMDKLL